MRGCEWRTACAWALGMVSASLAIAIVALGIGLAVRIGHHDSHRVCAKGHDADPSPGVTSPYFVCDEWAPAPAVTSLP